MLLPSHGSTTLCPSAGEAGSTCLCGSSLTSATHALLAPTTSRPPVLAPLKARALPGPRHAALQHVTAVTPSFQDSTFNSLGVSQGPQARRGGRWLRPRGPPAPPPTGPPSPQHNIPSNSQQSSQLAKQSVPNRPVSPPSSAGEAWQGTDKAQLMQSDRRKAEGEPEETRAQYQEQSPLQPQHQQLEGYEQQQQQQLMSSQLELRPPPAKSEHQQLQEPYYNKGQPSSSAGTPASAVPQQGISPSGQTAQSLERGVSAEQQLGASPCAFVHDGESQGSQLHGSDALTLSMAAPDNGTSSSSSSSHKSSSTHSSKSSNNGWKQESPQGAQGSSSSSTPKRKSKGGTGQQRPLHFNSWRYLLSWLEASSAAQNPSLALSTAHAFMRQQQQQQQQQQDPSTEALDANKAPTGSAPSMGRGSNTSSSIDILGDANTLNSSSSNDGSTAHSTLDSHSADGDPTHSSTGSKTMSRGGEVDLTSSGTGGVRQVPGHERSRRDPGMLVAVLNELAKLATAREAEAGPRGVAPVEWEQLMELVSYLLAELEPCLIETQQQQQQQQLPQRLHIRNEASTESKEGSTSTSTNSANTSSYSSSSSSSSMTAPHLARLVRSLNMLLLLRPPFAVNPTPIAHSTEQQPLLQHGHTPPSPQQQQQQFHKRQQRRHRSLPFSLPSHWAAHLRAAVAAVLQHAQPDELTLLLRALSLDGACAALNLKGANSSWVYQEVELTSNSSTEHQVGSAGPGTPIGMPAPQPQPPSLTSSAQSMVADSASNTPSQSPSPGAPSSPGVPSSPSAVAASAVAAVLRLLPLLSPRQCSICLSCITLLEWQPALPWVQAVMSRLEQAELQATLQGGQGSSSLQQPSQSIQQQQRGQQNQPGQLQQQQQQQQAHSSQPGQQQPQPSDPLAAVPFPPMSVRDAEQVLVSLAHLHVHPPPRLADMVLRALAAAFVPTPLSGSATFAPTSANSPPGLQYPKPPQAPPSPYMPEASAAAAAALKAQGQLPPSLATNLPHSPPPPPQPQSSPATPTPAHAASAAHSKLPPYTSPPLYLAPQQAGTATNALKQAGPPIDPSAHLQLPSDPLRPSPSLTPTQLSSSLWAIASLGLKPPAPWLAAFMQITFNVMQGFSARTLAEVLWAIASLRWEPSQPWMDRVLAAMSSKVEELRAGEVAITVWALSRLRFRARPDLLGALFAHVTTPRLLPLLDGRGVSMLMTACARTNYVPPASSMRPLASRILLMLQHTASNAPDAPPQQGHALSAEPEADSSNQQQQHQQQRKRARDARQQTHRAANAPRQQAHQPTNTSGQHPVRQMQQEPQGSPLTLAPQGIANLAWAIEVRGLYTEYPELVPALHAASLAVMPHFSPVELGMLGVAIGSIVQAQLHAHEQAKQAKVKGKEKAAPSPPLVLPSSKWVAAYADASHHVLLQQHRAQQLSAAQRAGRDRGRASRGSSASKNGIGRDDSSSSSSSSSSSGVGSSTRVASSMFMGFARMSPEGKLPPSDWLDTWFEVTAGTLLTFHPRELEQVCEGLRLLRPSPAPPLPWVRAFSDRRDVLSDHKATNAHLRKQLLLVLRMLRNAWQAKASQASTPSPRKSFV